MNGRLTNLQRAALVDAYLGHALETNRTRTSLRARGYLDDHGKLTPQGVEAARKAFRSAQLDHLRTQGVEEARRAFRARARARAWRAGNLP